MNTKHTRAQGQRTSPAKAAPGAKRQHQAKTSPQAANLAFLVDDKRETFSPDQLQDDKVVEKLRHRVRDSQEAIVELRHLLSLTDDQRLTVLDLLVVLKEDLQFTWSSDNVTHDLFDAVLGCLVDNQNLERFERGRLAALEAAVLLHPTALDGACDRIAERFKQLGVKGINRRELLRDAKKIHAGLSHQHAANPVGVAVAESLPDCPYDTESMVPGGWVVAAEGVGRRGEDPTIPSPVLVVGRHVEVSTGVEHVTLAWHRGRQWHERIVPRAVVADSRSLVTELASYGLPVTCNTAKVLVNYLSEFEALNLDRLPAEKLSRRLGWQAEGGSGGFLLGETFVGGQADEPIRFRGADEGDAEIAAALNCKGSFEIWREAVSIVANAPQAKLALYASFVPVMLPVFDAPNFIVDFSGRTSSGKTSVLRLAASVWGCPDGRSGTSLLKTWDCTATYRERVPAVLNNLPFILDDSKQAQHPEDVAKTIYSVAQGIGRGRGTIKGVDRQRTWRTVLITSGEQPATSFTTDGGTRPRVLSLWGSPFGETSTSVGQQVRRLTEQLDENFGHAGPRFVQFVVENGASRAEWLEHYQAELQKYQSWAEDYANPYAGRMGAYFATISVTAALVHEALDLPWDYEDPIWSLWESLTREAGEADQAALALKYVVEWGYSNQHLFCGRSQDVPHRGWAGRWDKGGASTDSSAPNDELDSGGGDWEYIAFIPATLKEVLKQGGFDPTSTIKTWSDEGWLRTNCDGRNTLRVRIPGEHRGVNMYAITREAIDQVDGD